MTNHIRGRLIAAALATSLAAIGASPAIAGKGQQYVGTAENDPHTDITFELKKGPKKVSAFVAGLRFACDDGSFDEHFFLGDQAMRVNKKNKFKRKLTSRTVNPLRGGDITTSSMKVTGKLRKKAKAKGTVDAKYTRPGAGPDVHCYSGKVDWKAEKRRR